MAIDIWRDVIRGSPGRLNIDAAVPLESKLSYQWARVADRDRMYSSVFIDRTRHLAGGATCFSRWLEARPVPNKPGRFAVTETLYVTGPGTRRDREPEITSIRNDSNIESRYPALYDAARLPGKLREYEARGAALAAGQRPDVAREPRKPPVRHDSEDGSFSRAEADEFMRGWEAVRSGNGRSPGENIFSSLYFSTPSARGL